MSTEKEELKYTRFKWITYSVTFILIVMIVYTTTVNIGDNTRTSPPGLPYERATESHKTLLTEFTELTGLTTPFVYNNVGKNEYRVVVEDTMFTVTTVGRGKDLRILLIDRIKDYEYIQPQEPASVPNVN